MCVVGLEYSWRGSWPLAMLACRCWRWRSSQVVISWCTRLTSVGKSKNHVRRNSRCILISIWDITERYLCVVGFVSS